MSRTETAIVLFAFIVVAAVFAYTVLNAGLFRPGYREICHVEETINLDGSRDIHQTCERVD